MAKSHLLTAKARRLGCAHEVSPFPPRRHKEPPLLRPPRHPLRAGEGGRRPPLAQASQP